MTTDTQDQVAHWQGQIATLEARIDAQDTEIAKAQEAASQAALTGTDTDAAVRAVAHARDVHDALRAALGEARRHLKAAHDAHAQRDREKALDRARKAAKARLEAAAAIDSALIVLDQNVAVFHTAGREMATHLKAAGRQSPSHEKLTAGHAMRGAAMCHAPTFASVVSLDRVTSPDRRIPLHDAVAVQVSSLTQESGR